MQPGTFVMVPGTETWGQTYGPIGVVAAVLLVIAIIGGKALFTRWREDSERVTALNEKLVETVQTAHREAIALVVDSQKQHETRYEVLLERHIAETGRYADALREQSAATTAALSGLVKKISSRGPE